MKARLDLNSIYTDVKLLDKDSISGFAGIEELEEGFLGKGTARLWDWLQDVTTNRLNKQTP